MKRLLMAGALGAAVGGPYVATEWSNLKAKVAGESTPAATTTVPKPLHGLEGHTAVHPTSPAPPPPRILLPGENPHGDTIPIVDIKDALRFDITPNGVISRWPRVSTGITEDSLQGMRVTLITGMREDDLAGALTYYFVPSQKCSKITFSGTTGNPHKLIALATERFGFHGFTSGEPGVMRYEIRWNGKAHSELLIRPAKIVKATSPLTRYEVQMLVIDPAVR